MQNNSYIYGKLNKELEKVIYEGSSSESAIVTVDNINRKISVDVKLKSVLGSSGEVILHANEWSNNSQSCAFAELGAYDAIFFYPQTLTDKTVLQTCKIFVTAEANNVTFQVETLPGVDITLNYFIAKGNNNE